MPFRFRSGESPGSEARRIARELIARTISDWEDDSLGRDVQIHRARVHCKKLRSLLRLCRPCLGSTFTRENRALRDAARLVSQARDDKILRECFSSLARKLKEPSAIASVSALANKLDAAWMSRRHDEIEMRTTMEAFCSALRGVRSRLEYWPLDELSWGDLRAAHRRALQQVRKGLERCKKHPDTENFHQWRKDVKYYLYQLDFLRDFWHSGNLSLRKQAALLAEDLGADHDLAVLLHYLEENEEDLPADGAASLRMAAFARRRKLEQRAFKRAKKLLASEQKLPNLPKKIAEED